MRFFFHREQVEHQIVQNLIEAGMIAEGEANEYLHKASKLDEKDLLTVLLESHNAKEASQSSGIPSTFYYIDPRSMWNLN